MTFRSYFGPLAVVTQVVWPTHTQEARPQVVAGTAVETRLPQALVYVLTDAARLTPARTTAVSKIFRLDPTWF